MVCIESVQSLRGTNKIFQEERTAIIEAHAALNI
jgi:hypothetical protein